MESLLALVPSATEGTLRGEGVGQLEDETLSPGEGDPEAFLHFEYDDKSLTMMANHHLPST